MRRIIMIALLAIITAVSVNAQQNGERPQGRGERGPSPEYLAMIDSLGLDTDQKQQFDAMESMFQDKRRKEMKAARESGEEREVIREKANKIQEEQLAVLKNLFTEQQYDIYADFMKKQQEARKGRRGRGQG